MKPYYDEDGVRIYLADCREVLASPLAAFVTDIVLTDPPYGVSVNRGDGRRALVKTRVFGDDEPFDPSGVLSLGLPTVLWGANAYASRLPDSTGWLVWDKTHAESCEHSQAELAWTSARIGIRVHREAYHGFMRRRDGWLHPTQKPPGLMQWCLSLPAFSRGSVLDPFMGSGTTLVAAKQLGRRAIGIEIEERYCEIAAKRLAQTVMRFDAPAPAEPEQQELA